MTFSLTEKARTRLNTTYHVTGLCRRIVGSINVSHGQEGAFLKHWRGACTSCQPISKVNLIRCAQCGLQLRYSAASSAVASRLPPPPIKEPPQMRYSPGRFLLTADMRGELRVTIMWSSA